jgi:hypothetical protein
VRGTRLSQPAQNAASLDTFIIDDIDGHDDDIPNAVQPASNTNRPANIVRPSALSRPTITPSAATTRLLTVGYADENHLPARACGLTDPEDVGEAPKWAIDTCHLCETKDTPMHAYLQCPAVNDIWIKSIALLLQTLNENIAPQHLTLTIRNIVLCFPDLVNSLPTNKRARIILWHSAVIYTITQIRTEAIWKGRERVQRTIFNWGGDDRELVMKKIKYEIRRLIWQIFTKNESLPNFKLEWCDGNDICIIADNKLKFLF